MNHLINILIYVPIQLICDTDMSYFDKLTASKPQIETASFHAALYLEQFILEFIHTQFLLLSYNV